jgi:hypothetical protein
MNTSVVLFSFLAGVGCGLLLALVAVWLAEKFIGDTLPGDGPMAGLEVSDSSMGEFEAVARRAA